MKKYSFDAVIFDLDGVITKTALVHAKAWKKGFEEYLRLREERDGEPFREFTREGDYLPYVDGKPRYEGVKSFLESRGISIPYGDPSDPPDTETICGVGNKKNTMFRKVLDEEGAEMYPSTVELVKQLRSAGIRVGVASSSKNCQAILKSAGIEDLFETRVDGVVSAEIGLKGKPEGDIFITAARNIGAVPARSVVVEDALSGVQAGRNGGFGLVLGVARESNTSSLAENGADIVVEDLAEISIDQMGEWFLKQPKPLFDNWEIVQHVKDDDKNGHQLFINPYYARSAKSAILNEKKLVFFLDYDGTLTPIVDRPDLAVMAHDMRDVVRRLSQKHTVAIVSGRMREDVENLVGIEELLYAGSHGFDIKGPGFSLVQPKAQEVIPVVSGVIKDLKSKIGGIPGVLIEEKKFSTAVHYRLTDQNRVPEIKQCVDAIVQAHDSLRLMSGKMVFEILPNIEWNKGMAIRWIVNALSISWDDTSVVYIGDDVTDEFAFRTIRTRGTGILVSEERKGSAGDFLVSSPVEVKKLFEKVIESS